MLFSLVQTSGMAPGVADLKCPGVDLAPGRVEVSFAEPTAGGKRYLDPRDTQNPWAGAEFWLTPRETYSDTNGILILRLDPSVTYHLRPNRPYFVALREAGGNRSVQAQVSGVALRLPSSPPAGWRDASERDVPLETEPTDVAPLTVSPQSAALSEPIEAPAPISKPSPAPRKSALGLIALATGGFVILAAAGWWFLLRDQATPAIAVAAATAAPERTLATARAALAGQPDAATARRLAEEHLIAKDLDGAFLLFRSAAEKGDAAAAIAIGSFYDPDSWRKDTSPFPAPNPDQAATWFRRAADAGNPEAQYRLGMVLKSGKTEAPDGPEQAVVWLRKSAEQGYAKAKGALGQ